MLLARARHVAAVLVVSLSVLTIACGGAGPIRQYEYEEDLHLSLDGSATVYVNASIPSLVALRGVDLDLDPAARLDRARLRALYTSAATRVGRVSASRRLGRRFVHLRIEVSDVAKLPGVPPFAWSSYSLRRDNDENDEYVYEQTVGKAAKKPVGDVGWRGTEGVAFRVHLPSKVRFHNAQRFDRGNILVWEEPLNRRLAGAPLRMQARMETVSILYRTLWLFAAAFLAAVVTLGAIVWWVVRRAGDGR